MMFQRITIVPAAFALLILSACVHSLSMHSQDGEKLNGQYRFARENTGLIQVVGLSGEVLAGKFVTVARATFVESYTRTFGSGTILVDGPDISAYGNAFSGSFGSSHALVGSAYGENFNTASGNLEFGASGPLFYWTASLHGDRGSTMGCYLIGSSYTGRGFGRCKSQTGKEYSVSF
jgi:hypothetical protein